MDIEFTKARINAICEEIIYTFMKGERMTKPVDVSALACTVTPEPKKKDKKNTKFKGKTVKAETEKVEVIWEFEPIDGWTSAMAGEPASGLKYMPASGAIYGSIPDPVTHTGIRRDQYGDYCAALGLHFGLDNDRYLIVIGNFR